MCAPIRMIHRQKDEKRFKNAPIAPDKIHLDVAMWQCRTKSWLELCMRMIRSILALLPQSRSAKATRELSLLQNAFPFLVIEIALSSCFLTNQDEDTKKKR
jgi:hypothetical protein